MITHTIPRSWADEGPDDTATAYPMPPTPLTAGDLPGTPVGPYLSWPDGAERYDTGLSGSFGNVRYAHRWHTGDVVLSVEPEVSNPDRMDGEWPDDELVHVFLPPRTPVVVHDV